MAYQANDELTVGGSADLVYAGLDMQMLIDGAQMNDMLPVTMNPFATQSAGEVVPDATFAGMLGSLGMLHYAHFDMNKEGDYSSEATAFGFAGKLGLLYDVSETVTIGASCHLKSALADLEGLAKCGNSCLHGVLLLWPWRRACRDRATRRGFGHLALRQPGPPTIVRGFP
ncbi:MAG: hypothetical protein CME06_14510 [Gemmatimonadetes bacterium]|nr:hypothetical protein [Gemmatimonadota bacterium]